MPKLFRITIITLRIALGGLFIYGGIQKFVPKSAQPQTEYFWSMLGVVELVGGILLISQYLSLLGAVLLLPITFNIFMFHAFLTPHETGEVVMTILYLLVNILIIVWHYPRLKPVFLNFKSIYR